MLRSIHFLLTAGVASACPSAPIHETPAIVPQPRFLKIDAKGPGFAMGKGIYVHYSVSRSELGRAAIRALMAENVPVFPEEMTGELTVELVPGHSPLWFSLKTGPEGIRIRVADPAGFAPAARVLAQSIMHDQEGIPALPAMQAEDESPAPSPSSRMPSNRSFGKVK